MLRKRRFLSVLLSLVLILGTIPITAIAEQTESERTGLCEHHPQHTDECGYTEGTPCTYVCEICNPRDSGETEDAGTEGEPATPGGAIDSTVSDVQALIDALPTAEELESMTQDEQAAVYEQVQAAYDAYNALTDEQKEQIAGAEMFDALFAVFNGVVNALVSVGNFNIDGGTQNTDYSYSGGVLTILTDTELTISNTNSSTATSDRIVVNDDVNANITLAGVNIQAPANTSAIDVPNGASLTLTLANGSQNTLTVKSSSSTYNSAGIHVPDNASLTIQCAAAATDSSHQCTENGSCGKLSVTGGATTNNGCGGAGIGGNGTNQSQGETSGSVSIIGGDITVIGGSCPFPGPGIGGGTGMGNGGGCGAVYITGGIVAVTGGSCTNTSNGRGAAGIGGGNSSSPFNSAGSGGTVVITGGTVSVTGGTGIGNGGYGGTGIGGGASLGTGGAGGTVIILTDVTVTSGKGNDSGGGTTGNTIGGGLGSSGSKGDDGDGIRPSSNGNYTVYGNPTLPEGVTLPDGITINIPDGSSLTLPEGASWPDNVTITGGGSIDPKLTATITISANLDKTHDGNAVSLDNSGYTYTGDTTTPTITITWHEDNSGTIGDQLTDNAAPSAPGTYWVKVSAAETSRYAAAEATKRFTISEQLDTPTGLTWSTTTPGQATWSAVANASGYSVQLYKDGSAQGSPVTASSTSYDFANTITQAGSYTFTVTATGSGAYSDSSPSSRSAALYTVSFDTNGGTGTIPMQLVPSGGTATEPTTAPTYTGHRFDGWYSDSSFAEGSKWTFATSTVTAATTLYAKWTASTYKVTLETNGGTVNNGNVTEYTYGEGATLPTAENVTREGYAFAGWYEDSAFTGNAVTAINATETGDKTYYAKWLSTNAGITSVSVSDTTGTVNGGQISVVLPADTKSLPTDSTEVSITLADSNAKVSALATADNGYSWTFTVTAEDGTTTASYTINVAIQISGTVAINGTPVCGQALTATYEGNADNVTYQWYRDDEEISDATDATYTLTVEDVGHQLYVIATAVDSIYTDYIMSSTIIAIGPSYTVTIPEKVDLGGTVTISASDVNVASGQQLEVAITDTSGADNAFTLTSKERATITYTVTNDHNSLVSVNDTILTVDGGVANAKGSETLTFVPPADADITYAGTYTGTVTFTVRLTDKSGSGN